MGWIAKHSQAKEVAVSNIEHDRISIGPESPGEPFSDTSDTTPLKSNYLANWVRSRISNRPNLAAIFQNSLWLFLDKIVRMGVALIIGVWIARYLGPSKFGLLNYAIAFSSLFGIVATLGLDSIVVRELVRTPEERDFIIGSAFTLKLVGSFIAVTLSVVGAVLLAHKDILTIYIVGITSTSFLFQSFNVIDLYFQSKVQSRYTVYASNAAFLLMAAVKVILLLKAAPVVAFAWASLGEAVLTALFLFVAFRMNHFNMAAWKPNLQVARRLLSSSWPLMLSGISVMISTRADQVLIGQMLTNKDVGLYSAAVRIAEVWYFIPLGIASSSFPMLIEAKKHTELAYHAKLQKLFTSTVLFAVGFSIVFTIIAAPIVKLLYGVAYLSASRPLSILIWSGVPVAFGCIWGNWMLLENKTGTIFYFQLNAAILNVLLNLILIPRFGIVGSAYATLISYSVGHTILAAVIKSQHKALKMLGNAFFPFPVFFRMAIGRKD
jgi:PST family polysaccharide transporter